MRFTTSLGQVRHATFSLFLLLVGFATAGPTHGQEHSVLSLIQFEKATEVHSKAPLQIVQRNATCTSLNVEEPLVVRCEGPTALRLLDFPDQGEKWEVRVIGITTVTTNGMLAFEGIAPLPVYRNTGNELLDDERYTAWKRQWVSAFPDRYADMVKNQ